MPLVESPSARLAFACHRPLASWRCRLMAILSICVNVGFLFSLSRRAVGPLACREQVSLSSAWAALGLPKVWHRVVMSSLVSSTRI